MKEGQGQSRNTTNSAGLETVQPCITGSAPLVDDLRTCRREHPNWDTTRVETGVETEEAGARQIGRRVTPSFRCSPYMSVSRIGREEPYSDSSHTRTSRMRPVEHAYSQRGSTLKQVCRLAEIARLYQLIGVITA